MSKAISFRPAIVLGCLVCGLLCGLVLLMFPPASLFGGRIAPVLELVAIAIIGIYTIFVASRIRRSDVEAVVPSRILEALDSLADGLVILDENQTILLANQAFCNSVGIDADQLTGTPADTLSWDTDSMVDGDDFPWNRAAESGTRQAEQLLRFQCPDGTCRLFSVNCSPIAGAASKTRSALVTFRDVTQAEAHRAELNSRLRHLEILAAHDPLTECLNRRALDPKLQMIWNLSIDNSQPIACLMIDIDHFKQVNDSFGHEVGDMVLRAVAAAIRQSAPGDALVCRYGGEEFCVILPNTSIDRATELAEQTRMQVAEIRFAKPERLFTKPDSLRTTLSIGVSESRFGAENPQELITQADQSLYLAKQQGRNRVMITDPSLAKLLQPERPSQNRD